ncbi:MAG: hypothetical protein U0Q16_11810 [Bryobacteraceae bacterium]
MHARALIAAAAALIASAQTAPSIDPGGIVNNASYLPQCMSNAGIAQGSLFAVFGAGLGPSTLVTAGAYPLSTTLASVSVRVTAGGTGYDALPLYASARQVGAILPSAVPPGDATVHVIYQGRSSAPASMRVRRAAFGIFTADQRGGGPAVVENVSSSGATAVNAPTRPLRPGQLAVIWGTGLGRVTGDESAGPLPGDLPVDVKVFAGDRQGRVIYRGRSGCCAGLDQIVFETPAGVEGCQVPLTVEVDGVLSNFATVAISQGEACNQTRRPAPVPSNDPNFAMGSIVFLDGYGSVLLPTALEDYVRLAFFKRGRIEGNVEPALWAFEPEAEMPSGSCMVRVGTAFPPQPAPQQGPLDAGSAVRVTGPGGTFTLDQNPAALGNYEDSRRVLIPPGRYRVDNGAGGRDVGPFAFETDTLALKLTGNYDRVARDRDLTVTWDYAGSAGNRLTLFGSSRGACGRDLVSFTCVVPADAGRFVVPSRIVSLLPVSGQIFGIYDGALNLSTTNSGGLKRFQARGLDLGVFIHISISAVRVAYE